CDHVRHEMTRPALIACLILVGAAANASGQQTIVAASRSIDWSKAGVTGGIPNRTTICATLNPGATASQITSAIASCPSGQVVQLAAGTFNLSSGITFAAHNNITLRGAGPDATFLIFTGNTGCGGKQAGICIISSS